MAVTVTTVISTPGKLIYELAQDGAAGTALTIANATLVTDAAGQSADSPIRQMISASLASDAAARDFALQGNPEDGSEGGVARITPVGVAAAWAVDAQETGNLLEYVITAPAGADSAMLEIQALHSLTR